MDPFLGEVRIFPWSWAPDGWALCNGTQLPMQQNAALNALLGQTFGGNSTTTFALPDLRGRTPIHIGQSPTDGQFYQNGQVGGAETVTLSMDNLPQHTHSVNALGGTKGNSGNASSGLPATVNVGAAGVTVNIYTPATAAPTTPLATDTFTTEGTSAPHNNMQPFLVLNFCIATLGIFPPRQ